MVTKEAVAKALLEEIYAAADAFCRHAHLECLMEVLKTVWNKK